MLGKVECFFGVVLVCGMVGAAEKEIRPSRQVQELTQGVPDLIFRADRNYAPIQVERSVAEAAGLHVLEEGRLVLVTDLELDDAIRALPKLVTEAYEPMCRFFGIVPQEDWQLTAFLMKENAPFVEAGYLPEYLPAFLHGFSFNRACWLYEQPSEYYRRHLLLHEMVHSLVITHQGFVGPLWYAEGSAEYLATHDISARPLQLGWMPPNREATPYYARIREIRDAVAAGRGRTFEEAFTFQRDDYASDEVYYWGWSLFWFLANHPDTQEALREISPLLKTSLSGRQLTERFFQKLGNKLPKICQEWEMFLATLDYGYVLEPMLWEEVATETLENEPLLRTVQAARGWQSTGIRVGKGTFLTLQAKGRFQIHVPGEEPYPCEANGVTIEYFRGSPLGQLQAAILPENPPEKLDVTSAGTFFQPHPVGRRNRWQVPRDGILFLRFNIPESRLPKCQGESRVKLTIDN
ncbi:MAG: hypothetical protein Q4D62_12095 [Planctomycetia bacterium]|nr:hypothetical protein [Planctomycetia bacterium]